MGILTSVTAPPGTLCGTGSIETVGLTLFAWPFRSMVPGGIRVIRQQDKERFAWTAARSLAMSMPLHRVSVLEFRDEQPLVEQGEAKSCPVITKVATTIHIILRHVTRLCVSPPIRFSITIQSGRRLAEQSLTLITSGSDVHHIGQFLHGDF